MGLILSFFMSSESQIEDPKKFVQEAIEADKLVVFSKTYWPYATKAKKLLTSIGALFKVYELNSLGEPRNGTILTELRLEQFLLLTLSLLLHLNRPCSTISKDN